MAVAAHTGLVKVSSDGTTFNNLDGCNQYDFNRTREVLETTDFAGGSARTRILGLIDVPLSFSGQYERADTAMAALETLWASGASAYVQILPDGTNGWEVEYKVESIQITGSVDSLVDMSCTLVSTGSVTAVP